jgi:hypothetical protein
VRLSGHIQKTQKTDPGSVQFKGGRADELHAGAWKADKEIEEARMAEPENGKVGKGTSFSMKRLSTVQWVMGPIAVLVVVGWIMNWATAKEHVPVSEFFESLFFVLSFFSAALIAVLIGLRVFGRSFLSEQAENLILSITSLLPAIGWLAEQIKPLPKFLTVVGSIFLAGVSIIAYWRRHLPHVATEIPPPAAGSPPPPPAPPATAPPGGTGAPPT